MNELKAKATNDLSKLNIIKFVYLNCRIDLVKILTFSFSQRSKSVDYIEQL